MTHTINETKYKIIYINFFYSFNDTGINSDYTATNNGRWRIINCIKMSKEAVVAYFIAIYKQLWSRDSVVGTATRFRLNGPGIESRWGLYFPHLGPTQPPVQWVPGLPGVKRPGRGIDHPPPPSAELKERAHLYHYSPSGPSWPVIG
jgi:hypothetical protein